MEKSRKMVFPAALGLLLLAETLLACGGAWGADPEKLKARSSFDFNCPQEQIRLTQIDGRTVGVTGCGKRAVYLESCTGPYGNLNCMWVLNSDSKPDKK